jgi:hypothetical protein
MKARNAKSRLRRTPDYYYYRGSRLSPVVGLLGSMVLCLWLRVIGVGITLNDQKLESEAYAKPVVVQADLNLDTTQTILVEIIKAFPEKSLVAQAVAKAESGLNPNREGIHAAGKYDWSSDTYKGECSIGLFQINLAEDGCKGRKVHWDKAEGETLEEKIAWLKVPANNIKVARQIYEESGFKPWSTYTNGSYQNFK